MSQLLTEDSEVVFEQSGETEEAMKQEGLLSSRRKEKTELEKNATSRWDPSKSNGIRPARRGGTGSRWERNEG